MRPPWSGSARGFGCDIIVLQAGRDARFWDPLTHLRYTASPYEEVVKCVGADPPHAAEIQHVVQPVPGT